MLIILSYIDNILNFKAFSACKEVRIAEEGFLINYDLVFSFQFSLD